jgi:histidine ammonia-lyase
MDHSTLTIQQLSISQLAAVAKSGQKIAVSVADLEKVAACRQFLDNKVSNPDAVFYGINTGFGSLCNVKIEKADIEQLQENLVLSHSCGTGNMVPDEIVRLMLLLKIKGLSLGYSGVAVSTIQRLVDFYNHDVLPVVFEQGSLGASGDLAPLAHMCLPLLGKGKVRVNGEVKDAAEVLKEKGWEALKLQSKEGLALLNGTQFMSSYASWNLIQSQRLLQWADVICALSLDGFDGKREPFLPYIHNIRPHSGQMHTAQNILTLLEGSEIADRTKEQVQDPYSFRCVPQVHGASKDTVDHVTRVVETEINAVTDNPIVVPEADGIFSGGNFHGQPLALVLDFLAIAMAEIASISERRTYLLISGQRNLPAFLVARPGLDSGLMIAQYAAAAIVSQSKQLCTPASVDSIVSSNGQEDHVSMGANAATKCRQVILNTERVLAIELLNATQALNFRQPLKTSPYLQKVFEAFRQEVTFMEKDRIVHDDIEKAIQFIRNYQL